MSDRYIEDRILTRPIPVNVSPEEACLVCTCPGYQRYQSLNWDTRIRLLTTRSVRLNNQ